MKEKIKCTIRYSILALVTGVAVGAIDTIFGRGLYGCQISGHLITDICCHFFRLQDC